MAPRTPNLNGRVDPASRTRRPVTATTTTMSSTPTGMGSAMASSRRSARTRTMRTATTTVCRTARSRTPEIDEDGDGRIDILDPDSDGDGLFDGTEAGRDCSAPPPTPASQVCIADADPGTTTGVLNPDTDHGGVQDGEEDANHDGKVDLGEGDPNDPADDIELRRERSRRWRDELHGWRMRCWRRGVLVDE